MKRIISIILTGLLVFTGATVSALEPAIAKELQSTSGVSNTKEYTFKCFLTSLKVHTYLT